MAATKFEFPGAVNSDGASASDVYFDQGNPYAIGAKRSFVPVLGEIVWELPRWLAEKTMFHAYIFRTNDGRQLGYVRVPDYYLNKAALNDFSGLVNRFERTTSAVVLDQVNNPGGNLFHMYSTLSNLINKPLELPKHQIYALFIADQRVATLKMAMGSDLFMRHVIVTAELVGKMAG